MREKENIRFLIKEIIRENIGKIKLNSDKNGKRFELDYHVSLKVANKLQRNYYFGTDLEMDSEKQYLSTFKELLKVKRALKEINR